MTLSSDTMRRDADAEALVGAIRGIGQPELRERGVEGARAYLEERAAAAAPGPEVDLVLDLVASAETVSVPVRVYRAGDDAASSPRPLVVYLHGGGFVIGSVAASDAFCRRLACATDAVVVSVDYRLAPEHPFPAGTDDAVAATRWAAEHAAEWGADPARLVVLGDSAGGTLATVAVRRLVRDGGPRIARQVLAYPVTIGRRPVTPTLHGREWPLTDVDLAWLLDQYVSDDARRDDPDVAPLLADVTGLPRTTLVLGGCDPLFAEGMAYAERLWSAGVEVDLHVYAGQVHGFATFDPAVLARGADAFGVLVNAVRTA